MIYGFPIFMRSMLVNYGWSTDIYALNSTLYTESDENCIMVRNDTKRSFSTFIGCNFLVSIFYKIYIKMLFIYFAKKGTYTHAILVTTHAFFDKLPYV
jgi:hypothetical protein